MRASQVGEGTGVKGFGRDTPRWVLISTNGAASPVVCERGALVADAEEQWCENRRTDLGRQAGGRREASAIFSMCVVRSPFSHV